MEAINRVCATRIVDVEAVPAENGTILHSSCKQDKINVNYNNITTSEVYIKAIKRSRACMLQNHTVHGEPLWAQILRENPSYSAG